MSFPGGSVVKNLPASAEDSGLIPGLGRSLGEEINGNPLQYSCLENPTDRGVLWATVHRVTKSWTWLSMHTEKAMAPHSSTLAWKIPWVEEPGRLQSMGSGRVGYDWATSLSRIGEGNGNPLQCSCLENPRDGGAWWAAVYVIAQSQTQLRQLGSGGGGGACMHVLLN